MNRWVGLLPILTPNGIRFWADFGCLNAHAEDVGLGAAISFSGNRIRNSLVVLLELSLIRFNEHEVECFLTRNADGIVLGANSQNQIQWECLRHRDLMTAYPVDR